MRRLLCAVGAIVTTFGMVLGASAGSADAHSTHSSVPPTCLASHLTATGFWEGTTELDGWHRLVH